MISGKWYDDPNLVRALPRRYRAYSAWSRAFGDSKSRRVRGGSFVLRLLRQASRLAGRSTVARIRGIGDLVVVADFADQRILDVIHEIRGENTEYRVLSALLSEGDTFIDVGANFGTFSLLAARMVGAAGSVVAIEPQPRLAGFIAESITLSGINNCEIRQVACANNAVETTLLVPSDDSGRAGLFAAFSGRAAHQRVTVKTATLDSVIEGVSCPGRMLIKIDVEGSEFGVLDGARATIRSRRPTLLIEINPWSASAAGRTTADLLDVLQNLGYRSFATARSFPEKAGPSSIPLNSQGNIVAFA